LAVKYFADHSKVQLLRIQEVKGMVDFKINLK